MIVQLLCEMAPRIKVECFVFPWAATTEAMALCRRCLRHFESTPEFVAHWRHVAAVDGLLKVALGPNALVASFGPRNGRACAL
jgi:hypothetical protein